MPAEARGHVRRLPSGKWQLRYYDQDGGHRSGGAFPTRTAAMNHYRDVVEPELLYGGGAVRRDVTLEQLVERFLDRHVASDRTIATLRHRLRRPLARFGDVPVAELERMGDELAAFEATLPERYRYAIASALRQTLRAGVNYGSLTRSPITWANPQPKPRAIRVFTADELDKIVVELDGRCGAAVRFAAATGLRPGEWASVERRDVDRTGRTLFVRGTKTHRSRREVPLTTAALAALDSIPARLDSTYVFAGPKRGPFDCANFGKRDWHDAIDTAGITKPARLYDLRSTFASNALANGVTVYELARIMGTSVAMIEAHYGALLDSAHDAILARLEVVN